jgi:uncharacterized RmlC-like cupin family protein
MHMGPRFLRPNKIGHLTILHINRHNERKVAAYIQNHSAGSATLQCVSYSSLKVSTICRSGSSTAAKSCARVRVAISGKATGAPPTSPTAAQLVVMAKGRETPAHVRSNFTTMRYKVQGSQQSGMRLTRMQAIWGNHARRHGSVLSVGS